MEDKIKYLESMGYWVKVKKPQIILILKTGEINFNCEMSIEDFKTKHDSIEFLISGVNKSIKEYLK